MVVVVVVMAQEVVVATLAGERRTHATQHTAFTPQLRKMLEPAALQMLALQLVVVVVVVVVVVDVVVEDPQAGSRHVTAQPSGSLFSPSAERSTRLTGNPRSTRTPGTISTAR